MATMAMRLLSTVGGVTTADGPSPDVFPAAETFAPDPFSSNAGGLAVGVDLYEEDEDEFEDEEEILGDDADAEEGEGFEEDDEDFLEEDEEEVEGEEDSDDEEDDEDDDEEF